MLNIHQKGMGARARTDSNTHTRASCAKYWLNDNEMDEQKKNILGLDQSPCYYLPKYSLLILCCAGSKGEPGIPGTEGRVFEWMWICASVTKRVRKCV